MKSIQTSYVSKMTESHPKMIQLQYLTRVNLWVRPTVNNFPKFQNQNEKRKNKEEWNFHWRER